MGVVGSFPVEEFTVPGDPGAMSESAAGFGRSATTAGEVATHVGAVRAGSWQGAEGDLFRSRVAQFPPPLDAARESYAAVEVAVRGFADVVRQAQAEMAALRGQAQAAHAAAQQASGSLLAFATANPAFGRPGFDAGQWAGDRQAAQDRAAAAEDAWAQLRAQAAAIRARVEQAAQQAGVAIRAVSATPAMPSFSGGGADGAAARAGEDPPEDSNPVLDGLQLGLDVAGVVPVLGEAADGVNAAISAGRGDWEGAALSAAGMIPFAGWGATGAKGARKAAKALDAGADSAATANGAAKGAAHAPEATRGAVPPRRPSESPVTWTGRDSGFRKKMERELGQAPPGTQAHHVFPVAYGDRFAKLGIDANNPKFGSFWDATIHQKSSWRYQQDWANYLRQNPTQEQVLEFGRNLGRKYGFSTHY